MTEYELMELIGEAEDEYIMASRRRPRKKAFPWTKALAACLTVAVIGTAGALLFRSGLFRSGASSAPAARETLADREEAAPAEDAAPAEAPAQAEEDFGESEPAEMEAAEAIQGSVRWLSSAQYPASVGWEDYDGQSQVWRENQTSDTTKSALNAFAYETAAALLRDSGTSGAYSPLSLYQALAVLTSGAGGQTRDQLLSLLGQSDLETLADQAGRLYRVNYADNEVDVLKIANSLWLDETAADGSPVSYHRDWVMSAAADYYADVLAAEFSDEETALALGEWISLRTGGLLHPSSEDLGLDENTLMSMVNTLWYASQWATEFDKDQTAEDTFTLADGAQVTADFMHSTQSGMFIRTERYTKSYLPLHQGRMIFVLPAEGVSVDELLTEENLWEAFENGDYTGGEVRWSIPKFTTDASFELKDTLQSLGITDAFTEGADFSAISDTPLHVSKILQGTHIGLDEEGVEAAAYTAVAIEAAGAPVEDPVIAEMNLNRPFLYLITANDGSPLFIGVVRNPTE